MNKNLTRINELVTSVDSETTEFLNAVCPPIYESTVFKYNDFETVEALHEGKLSLYGYSRTEGTPTTDALNRLLAKMENGEAAMSLSSGTAAIFTAMISCLKAGDHVVIDKNAYGRPISLLMNTFSKFGITYSLVSMKNIEEVKDAVRPETTLIYLESPNSWLFEVADIRAITKMAKEKGIRTIIDNTYSTPVFQNPIDMGVDVVVHSATKYLGGHSCLIGGVIVSSKEFIRNVVQVEAKMTSYEASKLMLNLRTLPLRMERHSESARKVCKLLESDSKVAKVFYPGSRNYPQKELVEKQMYGISGTMSFILDCDREGTRRFINALRVINIGGTWGSYDSTIQTTDFDPNFDPKKETTTLYPHHCRLSVGLEDVDMILDDLSSALKVI